MHFFWRFQLVLLNADEIRIFVFIEYANFADIFFKNLEAELLEYTGIDDHAINVIERH